MNINFASTAASPLLRLLAISTLFFFIPYRGLVVTAQIPGDTRGPHEKFLDEAMLTDMLTKYSTYEGSDARCTSSVATDITFEWPGPSTDSEWSSTDPDVTQFEQELFQAQMSFADGGGNRSWRIRM